VNKIPFSIYDFFGYLGCGFLLLAAIDFAFNGGSLLKEKADGFTVMVLFWIVLVYILGHLIANLASSILENRLLRKSLGSPEELLFHQHRGRKGWGKVFPGYFTPLPKETAERVLAKAKELADITSPGRALFFHCHSIVKREPVTMERLNNFLNAYGFCRNVSLTALLSAAILLVPVAVARWHHSMLPIHNLAWTLAALVAAVGMLYRYLKFFRLYTVEVFISYAETEVKRAS
jgi:hypothetical protein